MNGKKTGSATIYDSVVTFTCNTGHNLTGSSVRTCQQNGKWSGIEPICDGKTSRSYISQSVFLVTWFCFQCNTVQTQASLLMVQEIQAMSSMAASLGFLVQRDSSLLETTAYSVLRLTEIPCKSPGVIHLQHATVSNYKLTCQGKN